MAKVGIIYDFGVNKGGGDFVMLKIIEALLSKGYDTSLMTSYPGGLQEAANFFGRRSPNVEINCIKVPYLLKHPYTIAFMAKKIVKSEHYDVYIVSDDVPTCISNKKGICYAHYSHAARFKFKDYVAERYRKSLSGRLIWQIHKALFPRYYLTTTKPKDWLFISNSLLTRDHLAKVFHTDKDDIALLNPPVASREIDSYRRNERIEKEDIAVCIGRFEREKRFIDVLHAIAHLKNRPKLSLIGFTNSERELMKVIKALGLSNDVELIFDADRKTVINRLLMAKVIIHPTPHEPFGIAVVEGMAAGCVPIVRKGFNGPWMEITQEGRYGLGFNSIKGLANALKRAVKDYGSFNIEAIVSRALEFDEIVFKQRFLEMFENFITA